MENHPLVGNLWFEHFKQMPGNTFTLTVLISCQQQFINTFETALQFPYQGFFALDCLVIASEAICYIDSHPVFGEIPDMSLACNDLAGLGEKFCYRFRLGR